MTLVELAGTLLSESTAVNELRRGRETAFRYTTIAEQLRELSAVLDWSTWFLGVMTDEGFTYRPDMVRSFAAAGRAKLGTTLEVFHTNPGWLLEGRNGMDL